MLKLMFILVIFILTSGIGYIYGESFKKRYEQIKEFIKFITLLQNNVVYNYTPLPNAIEETGDKMREPLKTLTKEISNNLLSGDEGDVFDNFSKVYEKFKVEFYLQKDDVSIIEDFFKSLGSSGVYGQEKIFKLALENLNINLEEALTVSKKNSKLYRYLGVCVGAMIAIFIL